MRGAILPLLLVMTLAVACAPQKPVDVDRVVSNAAAIVLLTHDGKDGRHRVAEILKNDGSYALEFKVGDSVRIGLSDSKYGVDGVVAIIDHGYFGSELVKNTPCTEMTVAGYSIPALNGITLDQLRALAKKKPNQPLEPTSGLRPAAAHL
jgi:hypothetical protein